MKQITIILLTLILTGCHSKKATTTITTKDAAGNLIGYATKNNLLQEPYKAWFTENYDFYETNPEVIAALKPLLKNITIKVYMGTWCGDSQEQVPPFYKIIEQANFNQKKLELIALDRAKKTPDNLQEGFDIIRVPTFIFYNKGKELGRIVEYPQEMLEDDMLKILSGQPYKHSYEK